jgi:hypothetical protein
MSKDDRAALKMVQQGNANLVSPAMMAKLKTLQLIRATDDAFSLTSDGRAIACWC